MATNLNSLGVSDKVIQRILRHSTVAVTQGYYIKPVDEDVKTGMAKLEAELASKLDGKYSGSTVNGPAPAVPETVN